MPFDVAERLLQHTEQRRGRVIIQARAAGVGRDPAAVASALQALGVAPERIGMATVDSVPAETVVVTLEPPAPVQE